MTVPDGGSVSPSERWEPPPPPNDGVTRMFRVYGYRYTGDPQYPFGDSLGQVGVGTTNYGKAVELRNEWCADRPGDCWVIEWTVLR